MRKEFYALRLTPLSPLHIGTGDTYDPTNYIIRDGLLLQFDPATILREMDPSLRAILDGVLREPMSDHLIRKLQKFFAEHGSDIIMAHHLRTMPVSAKVETLYQERLGAVAQRESTGRNIINQLEIKRPATDPASFRPLLFGSSLKGSLRTAILDSSLAKIPAQNRGAFMRGIDLEKKIFNYQKFEQDPLRLLQISDAHIHGGDEGEMASRVFFALNRKKFVQEKINTRASNLDVILESLTPARPRLLAGSLHLTRLDAQERGKYREKVPDRDFSLDDIVTFCNSFYIRNFHEEMESLRSQELVDVDWERAMNRLIGEIKGRPGTFLLRCGFHTGAESKTLEGYRNISVKQKSGNVFLDHATTVWLAGDAKEQMSGLIPFGWLLVEATPEGGPLSEWTLLDEFCQREASLLSDKRKRFDSLRKGYLQKDEERRQKRQEEEARLTEQRRIEEEKKKRLASLSPNLQTVEGFVAKCEGKIALSKGKKDRPFTEFYSLAKKLVEESRSQGWSEEEAKALGEAILFWVPQIESIDKKDLRKRLGL